MWAVFVLLILVPSVTAQFLIWRLSSFRLDRPQGGCFGAPYRSIGKVLKGSNYREEGQIYLERLAVVWPISIMLCGIGVYLIGQLLD